MLARLLVQSQAELQFNSLANLPMGQIQIVLPSEHPNPTTKIGSGMGGAPTPKMVPLVLTHSHLNQPRIKSSLGFMFCRSIFAWLLQTLDDQVELPRRLLLVGGLRLVLQLDALQERCLTRFSGVWACVRLSMRDSSKLLEQTGGHNHPRLPSGYVSSDGPC